MPRTAGLRAAIGATVIGLLLTVAAPVAAVTRSCGPDATANTANVLCAPPSGPCTAATVTMSENIEVADAGCTFDLGGRALVVQKTFNMIGTGFIQVVGAADITITATGKLKARGDFVMPNGFIIGGGLIALTSAGTITVQNGGLIDVSGDAAGTVRLTAAGDVVLQGGGAAEVIRGTGVSSFTDEGERFADGGTLEVVAQTGSITIGGLITQRGANQAAGGSVDLLAARNIDVNQQVDCSGGGSDGGAFDALAGDNITITKTIDLDSRVGGGFGGTLSLAAGQDDVGGGVPGGALTVNTATLRLNGSDAETFGGDGGDLEAIASGPITFTGTGAGILSDGGVSFDGTGGSIFLDSGDVDPNVLGPLDGDINVAGVISARSGGADGDGGTFDASAGRNLVLTASINLSGVSTGGDVIGEAGGTVQLDGTITALGTSATGGGGAVDFTAGLAQGGNAGQLRVTKNILASGGASNGSGQSITLAGCTLTVSDTVKIDGHAGMSAGGIPGGSDIELTARGLMDLRAGSQYLANPGGTIVTTHPPGQNPVIGAGVVFNPPRIDNATLAAFFPNCPICGDGTLQAGEGCDDGGVIGGDGCSASCTVETGWGCSGQPSVCVRTCGDGILTGGEQCDDGNLVDGDGCDSNCTPTRCGNGVITAGETCDDGNSAGGDCCSATCGFEPALSACTSDGNACTDDICNGAGVCAHVNNTAPCSDGNACTTADTCAGGSCVGGPPLDCNDGNLCTADSCSPASGCVHAANTISCDDGAFCTVNDRCEASVCQGVARDCDDGNACTADGCDETADQCVHDPAPLDGAPCDDGAFCSVNDRCQAGVCQGSARDCSGVGDQCNDGVCNEASDQCVAQPKANGTVCDDGNQCTLADACASGLCQGDPMTCGDGVTQGSCGESCDDGNVADGDGCDSNCTPTGCGNGIVTAGEECDDAALVDGDGCSATCAVEPGWTCSGQPSTCSEVCGDGIRTAGEECDDGNLVARDGCSPTCARELCAAAPASGCRRPLVAQKALVVLKDKTPSDKDALTWKWLKGAAVKADFGNPRLLTRYALCVYDDDTATPRLKLSSVARSGFCAAQRCWKETTAGFTYKDRDLSPHGIQKIVLKEGQDGNAKVIVKGKGASLAMPDLAALVQRLRVQLVTSDGVCWEALYSAPALRHQADVFKDEGD